MTSAPVSPYGDPAALAVDRAVAELRAGRPVRVEAPDGARLVAAVETLRAPVLAALVAADSPRVATTAERAAVLGWTAAAAGTSRAVPATVDVAVLRELAGAVPMDRGEPAAKARPVAEPPGVEAATRPPSAAERAALALAKHARLLPTIVSVRADGPPDPQALRVTVAQIEASGEPAAIRLERVSEAAVPLADEERSRLVVFRDERDGSEHVAVLVGDVKPDDVVDVRVHSACLTGDLLGSLRCDCGDQLRGAIRRFAQLGAGVLLYVDQEGRGIGLANKIRAYRLQDAGLDTIDADRHLGFVGDERRFEVAARMLRELGIARVRLHTNNPRKVGALGAAGIDVVGFRTLAGAVTRYNEDYIRVRRERAGHVVPDPEG